MNRTIWKFPLHVIDEQIVEVPADAVALSVGAQGNYLCLWAEVDPDRPRVERRVYVQGTGNPLQVNLQVNRAQFVGTVQMPPFVWRVYMEPANA